MLTHRFDTKNITHSFERLKEIREKWKEITKMYLQKGNTVSLTYWPGDLSKIKEDQYSTFGVKDLEPYNIEIQKLDLDMEKMVCNINEKVIEYFLKDTPKDCADNVPWFQIEIMNKKGEYIYTSHDKGSDVFINLSEDDMARLEAKGISSDNFTYYPLDM